MKNGNMLTDDAPKLSTSTHHISELFGMFSLLEFIAKLSCDKAIKEH